MTTPASLGVWVCPTGRHRVLDETDGQGGTPVTGAAVAGTGQPLCFGFRTCGHCRMELHRYVLAEDDDGRR